MSRNLALRRADMLVADMVLASSQMGHGTAKLAKDKENKVLISAGGGLTALLKNYLK